VLIKTKILHGGFKMEFKWLNKSTIIKEGKRIEIFAPKESDFFCNNGAVGDEGITPESLSNAPFYYTEVTGDFIMRVKVSHDFKDMYDSSSIMIMQDMTHWAKACFELTDFNTHAVVSVVTKDQSDDANGCNIDGNSVWLQVCRVGQSFAFHYSIDGDNYYMMRFFNLPAEKTLKVGLLAQAPTGSGGIRIYEDLTIEKKKVKNIRMGK
jgi:regulation of enolase protein 1 (concanavalin A-like superfamily)